MPLRSAIFDQLAQESIVGFWGTTAAIVLGCIWVFLAIFRYMRQRRIL